MGFRPSVVVVVVPVEGETPAPGLPRLRPRGPFDSHRTSRTVGEGMVTGDSQKGSLWVLKVAQIFADVIYVNDPWG